MKSATTTKKLTLKEKITGYLSLSIICIVSFTYCTSPKEVIVTPQVQEENIDIQSAAEKYLSDFNTITENFLNGDKTLNSMINTCESIRELNVENNVGFQIARMSNPEIKNIEINCGKVGVIF
jgi:hypothetical protein